MIQQDVEAGRRRAGKLALIELDRANVLLSAKDELRFFLPLRRGLPHGHRRGHDNRHHGHADQQRRHRVAVLTP